MRSAQRRRWRRLRRGVWRSRAPRRTRGWSRSLLREGMGALPRCRLELPLCCCLQNCIARVSFNHLSAMCPLKRSLKPPAYSLAAYPCRNRARCADTRFRRRWRISPPILRRSFDFATAGRGLRRDRLDDGAARTYSQQLLGSFLQLLWAEPDSEAKPQKEKRTAPAVRNANVTEQRRSAVPLLY